jgi:hypothetical protein
MKMKVAPRLVFATAGAFASTTTEFLASVPTPHFASRSTWGRGGSGRVREGQGAVSRPAKCISIFPEGELANVEGEWPNTM